MKIICYVDDENDPSLMFKARVAFGRITSPGSDNKIIFISRHGRPTEITCLPPRKEGKPFSIIVYVNDDAQMVSGTNMLAIEEEIRTQEFLDDGDEVYYIRRSVFPTEVTSLPQE